VSTQATATVGKFVWHEHASSDPARAQAFYKDLLGWEYEVFKPGEVDYTVITVGGQGHGGFPPVPEGTPAHWVGNVRVDSADGAAAQAKAGGGTVVVEPMDIGDIGRYAAFIDPEGAVLAVFQPEGDGPTGEGVFVWDELMATDVEAAKRFYGDVVGWTTGDMDMGGGFTYTLWKNADGADVGGAMPLGEISAPPHWLTYIGVGDVDATAARAKELEATVIREPWDVEGVGRLAIVQDPTGAAFGLFRPSNP
jgi:uncharacterized protein